MHNRSDIIAAHESTAGAGSTCTRSHGRGAGWETGGAGVGHEKNADHRACAIYLRKKDRNHKKEHVISV